MSEMCGGEGMREPTVKELRAFWKQIQPAMPIIPLLEHMLKFVAEVSESKTPLMTKMIIQMDGTADGKPFVLLWASANLADSPLARIEELKRENGRLEMRLAQSMRELADRPIKVEDPTDPTQNNQDNDIA